MTPGSKKPRARSSRNTLPRRSAKVAPMIRVDHAGELGAARIYDGQLRVLGDNHPLTPTIRKMRDQEAEHLDAFNAMIVERGVRPTLLGPIWHAAGFALGAGTALLGERALMACTAAVEEVIDDHYRSQMDDLDAMDGESELRETVARFREDEIHHRDTALAHGAEDTPGYTALSGVIRAGCRTAIWLSQRI